MSSPEKSSTRATLATIEAANEWRLLMHEDRVSAADERAFASWLKQSPVHVREYLRAEAVFAAMEQVDPGKRIDVEALLAAEDDTVVELGSAGDHTSRVPVAEVRRPTRWAWAAAAAVLISVLATTWYVSFPDTDVYVTGLGEQRRLILDDGSAIEMNTQSELVVRMSNTERFINLVDGEALFTVAKDLDRPFVVASDHATVRALGTQFNVHKRDSQVLVTVLEGRVAVEHTQAPAINKGGAVGVIDESTVELGAGDAAEVAPAVPIQTVTKVNTERAVAWTERRLIFDNEPLSIVIAEFNRYNLQQLVVRDPTLAAQRISAVFDADKPDALVRFLEQNVSIEVEENQSQLLIQAQE